jgi:hypothetical protein
MRFRFPRLFSLPALLALFLNAAAGVATGQSQPLPDIRAQVSSARLGAGYAQMIGLAATPEIAAAGYKIDSSGTTKPTLDVFRLPYQARLATLAEGVDLYWKVAGGYLRFKDDFPVTIAPSSPGNIASKWTAYSASGGLLVKAGLGAGFTLEPALDLGVARLDNSASYGGAASALQPLFDRLLFGWRTNAWLVTPSVGLEWSGAASDAKVTVVGRVGRTWIESFGETDPVQAFDEAANTYAIRGDFAKPSDLRVFDRTLTWVVYGGYAGFFGANRRALGFSSVADVGGGVELPIGADRANGERLRFSAGYLLGPDVHGWTAGVSVQY